MKILCDKQTLLTAVTNVSRAVLGNKSILPALEGILMRVNRSSLFLAGYNSEMAITTTIEVSVSEPGEIVLPSKLFTDIVRKLPGDEVELTVDDRLAVNIKSGCSDFNIMGISSSEYPEIPTVNDGVGVMLPQDTLHSMIRQTIFAVSSNDERPVHKGVLFDMEEGVLRLVAVDGSRLALRSENIQNTDRMRFVVPGRTLQEAMRLLNPDDASMVALAVGRRHIIMEINGYAVVSKLLEGEFLPYQKAIPKTVKINVGVNTRELIDAVDRASLIINDRMKSPIITKLEPNTVTVKCNTPMGNASDIVLASVQGLTDEDGMEMGFNSQYLLDALKNTESDAVRMELNDALSPLKIVPVEGDSFLFLVMPVRMKR